MSGDDFTIEIADWNRDKSELRSIREVVFIIEQRVPQTLEWDDKDIQSLHVIARDIAGKGIGTGRLTPEGQIGRMAVLSQWRNSGVGSALLIQLIELAKKDHVRSPFLNAQKKAIPFYTRHGFHSVGDEFMEAGIPHQRMEQNQHTD